MGALARPQKSEIVPILSSVQDKAYDGSYKFGYESADGTVRDEIGEVKNPGTEDEYVVVEGSYKYIDSNGEVVEVRYRADENGFVPYGKNIPEIISQSAADNAAEAASKSSSDIKHHRA